MVCLSGHTLSLPGYAQLHNFKKPFYPGQTTAQHFVISVVMMPQLIWAQKTLSKKMYPAEAPKVCVTTLVTHYTS